MTKRIVVLAIASLIVVVSVLGVIVTTNLQPIPTPVQSLETCSTSPIRIASTLGADVVGHPTQAKVNCFAWQTFIALNWPASQAQRGVPDPSATAQTFGAPNDLSLTVWQSFKSAPEVFLPHAQPPSDWNTLDTIPAICQASAAESAWPLFRTGSETASRIPAITQATGDILVDQGGNPVYYQTLINQDEFNYIVQTKLYDPAQQVIIAKSQGISLPVGKTVYGDEGAIELKAAWRILDGQPPQVTQRYKQTRAFIYNSDTNTCEARTMGLVGLHIIRKTRSMPDFMWSTFEQIDNVPATPPNPKASGTFAFFNPSCQSCAVNATPLPTVALPATPTLAPAQVVRQQPIPPDIQAINGYVQGLIQAQNPQSVWQYYQLVNVRWPAVAGDLSPGAAALVPLSITHEQFLSSNLQPVSNVTMETFAQQTDCLGCHVCATIAPNLKRQCDPNQPQLASDFSFVFAEASAAGTP